MSLKEILVNISFVLMMVVPCFAVGENTCSEVRLDKTSLKNVPVMDQDGSGLCYAYVSALLADAWRFSHGDKNIQHITSPLAAAGIGSKSQWNSNGYGYVDATLNLMRSSFSCDHKFLSRYVTSVNFITNRGAAFWEKDSLKRASTESGVCIECVIDGSGSRDNLLKFDRVYKEITIIELGQKVERLCKGHTIPLDTIPKPKTKDVKHIPDFHLKPKNVSNEVSMLLSKKNPQPVAVSICEDVLRDRTVSSLSKEGRREGCRNHHMAAVIGRQKKSDGTCEYLIRSSYGTSCRPYAWQCVQGVGDVWISETALGSNIEGFTWLE